MASIKALRKPRVSVIAQKNTAPLGGGKSVISGAVHATKVSGSLLGPKQERGEGSGPAHNTGTAMQETSLGNARANLAARWRGALICLNRCDPRHGPILEGPRHRAEIAPPRIDPYSPRNVSNMSIWKAARVSRERAGCVGSDGPRNGSRDRPGSSLIPDLAFS